MTVTEKLLAGEIVEFTWQNKAYLIQQENNKGWNYLSLWRTDPDPACLGRAFFDIFDGVGEETVRELFSLPCVEGYTLPEILPESGTDSRLQRETETKTPKPLCMS